jgi:citrate synthase
MDDMERPGLEGVIAARTRLSHVDGAAGRLVIAGYRLEDLAGVVTFEALTHLLWTGDLPTPEQEASLRHALAPHRALSPAVAALLTAACAAGAPPMDAARMAVGALSLGEDEAGAAVAVLGALPAIVGGYERMRRGGDLVTPVGPLGTAEALLFAIDGRTPHPERARALDTYLVTVSDHGLNASTFAARVVASTGSGLVDAVVAAIGALKGPLHGGAPGPALRMVLEIGSADHAAAAIAERLARGERLMGFGHRIYRVRDPRADVLRAAVDRLAASGHGHPELHALAAAVEAEALRQLAAHKPDRVLQTNVEFATALLLHELDLPDDLFTAVFAVGRAAGWTAHIAEQRATGKLIRPASRYVGPVDRARPEAAR